MNGFVLGTFAKPALEQDMGRPGLLAPGAFWLAHNVPAQGDVLVVMRLLIEAWSKKMRRRMAVFAATCQTLTSMPGRSP